jgi:hypothetical protein
VRRRFTSGARLVALGALLLAGSAARAWSISDGPACDAVARSAWQLIQRGDLDEADALLRRPGCPRPGAEQGRWLVLRAALLQARSFDAAALRALDRFARLPEAWPEDVELSAHLRRQAHPSPDPPLALRLDLLGGWTSNALAGLPVDPSTPGPRSPFVRADLYGRLLLPRRGPVQPSLEGLFSGFALADDESQRWTSGQVTARPGVLLGRDTRVLLAYKLDLYLMNQKGAVLYYQAHRAEAEVAWRRLLVFAGAGRRQFHESGRTRAEMDGGAGWTFTPARHLRLVLAGSLRYQLADDVAYDVAGGTLLVNTRVGLGARLALQVGGTLGYDHYVSSGEQRGLDLFGLVGKRQDLLTTATATLWGPSWRGVRLGLGYDFARRVSNATAPRDFSYQEHRVAVRLRYTTDLDPFAPRAARSPHAPLDYGIGPGGGTMDEERIQDLLRQDETDRRSGCGCGR